MHNYISCLCNYFLIDFVIFIIKVTVKESSFQLKLSKRLVATMLNPEKIFILDSRQYTTSATSFNFIKIFSDVPQGSILAIWDIIYLF